MALSTPPWISNYSTDSYRLSVFRILATREQEREEARLASWKLCSEPQTNTRSTPLSRLRGIIKPTPAANLHGHYSIAVGLDPMNRHRNRYMDIQPYDRTRVIVPEKSADEKTGDVRGRYLNASWVLELYGHKLWIASQAPLLHTAHTFLSLILQPETLPPAPYTPTHNGPSRIRTVVQLTNYVEGGRRKAHAYFPTEIGQSIVVSPEDGDDLPALVVTLINRQVIEECHCIWSTLSLAQATRSAGTSVPDISYGEESAENNRKSITQHPIIFHHMLYTSWPDHGVPQDDDRASLLAFIRLVDRTNRDTSLASNTYHITLDPDPPIIVGCSAGIGRTGSFIAISSLLRNFGFLPKPNMPTLSSVLPPSPLNSLPDTQKGDFVVQEVDSLREQRPGMVQRNEQISLIYDVLGSAFASAAS